MDDMEEEMMPDLDDMEEEMMPDLDDFEALSDFKGPPEEEYDDSFSDS